MELRSIRRATSAHVVATHGYCMQAGGPKMVFSAGADGLQIPAQKLYKLILEQVSVVSEEMMKELPPAERVFGATFLIAGGTVGAGIIALRVWIELLVICWRYRLLALHGHHSLSAAGAKSLVGALDLLRVCAYVPIK
mmetsp:Transcript_42705/g.76569  ORF Transcript_42705/g.76569 Transcript_42705/m.76569 type:complete len:138 (+) Transcript_42705:797-1210(+)